MLQTMQEITKTYIQESLDIARANEVVYLNELVAYWLHFEGYKYDQLTSKLVEIHVDVFKKSSPLQSIVVAISSQANLLLPSLKNLNPLEEEWN